MDKMVYRVSDNYPQVRTCPMNRHDLQIIFPLYSGTHSELTAIMQYNFQHLVLEEKHGEVSETLMGISKAEMRHLHLLGGAITSMGGTPKYVNPNTRSWWNASVVRCDKELCDVLLLNLRSETEAHKAYMTAADSVQNTELAALLRCIAADEKLHMDILTRMINCHCRKKAAVKAPTENARGNDCKK